MIIVVGSMHTFDLSIRSIINSLFMEKNLLIYQFQPIVSGITLHENKTKFKVVRGMRQDDTISPKSFTSILETVFKKLDWGTMGINVNRKDLSSLRFADDVNLIAMCLDTARMNST